MGNCYGQTNAVAVYTEDVIIVDPDLHEPNDISPNSAILIAQNSAILIAPNSAILIAQNVYPVDRDPVVEQEVSISNKICRYVSHIPEMIGDSLFCGVVGCLIIGFIPVVMAIKYIYAIFLVMAALICSPSFIYDKLYEKDGTQIFFKKYLIIESLLG